MKIKSLVLSACCMAVLSTSAFGISKDDCQIYSAQAMGIMDQINSGVGNKLEQCAKLSGTIAGFATQGCFNIDGVDDLIITMIYTGDRKIPKKVCRALIDKCNWKYITPDICKNMKKKEN